MTLRPELKAALREAVFDLEFAWASAAGSAWLDADQGADWGKVSRECIAAAIEVHKELRPEGRAAPAGELEARARDAYDALAMSLQRSPDPAKPGRAAVERNYRLALSALLIARVTRDGPEFLAFAADL